VRVSALRRRARGKIIAETNGTRADRQRPVFAATVGRRRHVYAS
jgi:hypothetical protein